MERTTMTTKILLSQSNALAQGGSTSFPGSENVRIVQFNPMAGNGFSGTVKIEQSYSTSPAATDYATLMTVDFTAHTTDLIIEAVSNAPSIRATISAYTSGGIAIYGNSAARTVASGGNGSSTNPTAVVDSAHKVAGSGSTFKINSAVVPAFTSDDVVYSGNTTITITDVLDGTNGATGKQDLIGTITATAAEINSLASSGIVAADMVTLAAFTGTSNELNYLTGSTSNIQTQLTAINSALPTGSIASMATTGAIIDAYFDTTPTVTITNLNNLAGLTATATDLNYLLGSAGTFTTADLAKLGSVTASAVEISKLTGFTGTTAELNVVAGVTSSTADINAVGGFAATGVTSTQYAYLSGLTQNVQAFMTAQPSLTSLTASVNDLNLMTGAFAGTGSFASPITSTEISYLNGLTSAVQTQLGNKRTIGVDIGINEIAGAAITVIEMNYLSGATANIQSQFNLITASGTYIKSTGTNSDMTVPFILSAGTAAVPSVSFTGATTSGLYLEGAGVGLAVIGTRFASADGVDFVIGTGATSGSPTLKGVGFGLTDPAYTFTGDTDSGFHWVGADSVAIVAGAEAMATFDAATNAITVGGTVVNNNTITFDGVFSGEKQLGVATVVDGMTVGQTSLYTVPTGRTAIITKIYVRLTGVTGFVDGTLLRMNIGHTTFTEIVDNSTNSAIFNPAYIFGTAGQVMPLGVGANTFPAISGSAGADYQILTSAAVLQADVVAAANSTTYAMELIVFGYEF
jgi:hypothetical protein